MAFSSNNISVAVRMCPKGSETESDEWIVKEAVICALRPEHVDKVFSLDHVFAGKYSNADIYERAVKPVIASAVAGYNATVLAYGGDSSVRTNTMMGSDNDPGVIRKAIEQVFDEVHKAPHWEFMIRVSFLEINGNRIRNLLEYLSPMENSPGDLLAAIGDPSERIATTKEDMFRLLAEGERNREMDDRSPQSHSIFRITIESSGRTSEEKKAYGVRVSTLNLVDLAAGTSSTVLETVVRDLSAGSKNVDYRSSEVTEMLQGSLGGNALAVFICNISASEFESTLSTLRFASSAQRIKNTPVVNLVQTEDASLLLKRDKEIRTLNYFISRVKFGKEQLPHEKEDTLVRLRKKIESLEKLSVRSEQSLLVSARNTISEASLEDRYRNETPAMNPPNASPRFTSEGVIFPVRAANAFVETEGGAAKAGTGSRDRMRCCSTQTSFGREGVCSPIPVSRGETATPTEESLEIPELSAELERGRSARPRTESEMMETSDDRCELPEESDGLVESFGSQGIYDSLPDLRGTSEKQAHQVKQETESSEEVNGFCSSDVSRPNGSPSEAPEEVAFECVVSSRVDNSAEVSDLQSADPGVGTPQRASTQCRRLLRSSVSKESDSPNLISDPVEGNEKPSWDINAVDEPAKKNVDKATVGEDSTMSKSDSSHHRETPMGKSLNLRPRNKIPIDQPRDSRGRRKAHKRGKSYACDICKKNFNHASNLRKHQVVHTGERPFSCDTCQKSFTQATNLDRHRRIHTGERPFSCDTCRKSFTQATNLHRHRRIHTGERPFSCNTCEKSFTHATSLCAHRRIHTGEKPFACNDCEKRFSYQSNLRDHRRVHTGEKPFACNVCEKRFSCQSNLRKHQVVHTGERPFSCDTCQKSFTQAANLCRHRKIHTG